MASFDSPLGHLLLSLHHPKSRRCTFAAGLIDLGTLLILAVPLILPWHIDSTCFSDVCANPI